MSRRRIYRRILIMILIASFACFLKYVTYTIDTSLPDLIRITKDSKEIISFDSLLSLRVTNGEKIAYDNDDSLTNMVYGNLSKPAPISDKQMDMSIGDSICINADSLGSYKLTLKLFNIFTIKTVYIDVEDKISVYAGGAPIGIYLQTDGVMVIGSGKIESIDGTMVEPSKSLVKPGDYIVSLNGIDISSKSQLTYLINKYGNEDIVMGISRNGEVIEVKFNAVMGEDKTYKLGIWVRDDTQGIGTLTFIAKDGTFGALGHGISDIDTGKILVANNGILYKADIWGIERGKAGEPGGLCGMINYENENILGDINLNTKLGIFGKITCNYDLICDKKIYDVAYKHEISEGKAYIRSNISGEYEYYEINITDIDTRTNQVNKGIELEVTDERLIELTGGIVQGMSGSPIIQDDKLIGAVTHVLVKDPKRGYGIFIENMLEKALKMG